MVVMVVLWSSAAAWRRMKSDIPASKPFLPYIKYAGLLVLTAICITGKKGSGLLVLSFLFYAGTSLIVVPDCNRPPKTRILAAIISIMLLVLPVEAILYYDGG
jgi:hypothetical protein